MLRTYGNFTYNCYRAAFFSFITAPAIVLFVGFMFLSFNNSLAGTFLSEARGLVGGADMDKVQVCTFNKPNPNFSDIKNPPSPVYEKPCVTTQVDAVYWQRSVDSTIRQFYWVVVFFGFVSWCFGNGILHQVINRVMLKLERNKQ
ncbi:hypothetical protein [Serratia entomophila]|uniref:hypothetical protein n=1 Tax=Serratia entomophila TaxID=42906 RepID=UPI001F4BE953|nr:hypothetical protein [Serratia entomophila]ULG11683.1 hypothetical protein 440p1_00067 [Serratia entomophila]ULG11715.1 hypothetical protein 442p_00025 [Serratia entomophila]